MGVHSLYDHLVEAVRVVHEYLMAGERDQVESCVVLRPLEPLHDGVAVLRVHPVRAAAVEERHGHLDGVRREDSIQRARSSACALLEIHRR